MSIVSKLLYFLDRRDRLRALTLLGMMVIGACLEGMGIGLVYAFISLLQTQEKIHQNRLLQGVYNTFGFDSTRDFLMWCGGGLVLLYLIKNIFLGFLYQTQYRFLFNRQVALSRRIFQAYLHSPYTFHLQRNSAELLRNVNNEVLWIFHHVFIPLCVVVTEALVVAAVMTVLLRQQPVASLVVLGVLGGASAIFFRVVRKKMSAAGASQQHHLGQSIKWVNQGLGGLKEAKVLGRENYFVNFYTRSSQEYAKSNRYLKFASDLPRLGNETIAVSGIMLMVILLLASGQNMQAIFPTLSLFAMASMRLAPSLNRIVSSLNSIRYFTPSVDVIYKDLVWFNEQSQSPATGAMLIGNASATSADQASRGALPFKHEIELRNVEYQYPGSSETSLKDISLSIPQGYSVAFVGASGAGKTTMVDVMLGLLPPTSGEVLVDGYNIHDDIRAWQHKIGYIPQPVYLSDDTIRRNIAFGLPDEQINEEDIQTALKAAQLEELIESLPEKLDTLIGEHGVRLSGGQRQRIGIARALYHDPEILVMDEATSALDNETETEITKAITHFHGQKTIIIIAHRLTTVRNCDCLFFMKNGRIVKTGTYDSLLETSIEFQNMTKAA